MRKKEFTKIVERFELEFGYKFLIKTREREKIEARAALIYYLKRFRGLKLVEITKLFDQYCGWKPNHATILHSTVNFDMYARFNRRIDDVLKAVIGYYERDSDKSRYIKQNIEKMPSEVIDKIHKQVVREYDKILNEDPNEETIKNNITKSL